MGISIKRPSQQYSHLLDSDHVLDPREPSSKEITTPDSLPDYCDSDNCEEETNSVAKRSHLCDDDSDVEILLIESTPTVMKPCNTVKTHPLQKVSIQKKVTTSSVKVSEHPNTRNITSSSQISFATHPKTTQKKTSPHGKTLSKQTPSNTTTTSSSSYKTGVSQPADSFSFKLDQVSELQTSHHHEIICSPSKVTVNIKPQMITKSIATSTLFLHKKSKLIEEIGRVCDIIVPPINSDIIVTGMKNQVDSIVSRLETEFTKFKNALVTEVIPVEAYFAPLFTEDHFVKSLNDNFSDIEILIQCSSGKRLTIDEVSYALKDQIEGRRDNKFILLNDLYKLGLIAHVESGMKQWFIQSFNGQWEQVPQETNRIFNENINSPMPITVKDGEMKYSVNLHQKTATCTRTGFQHPLKNEAMWYHKVIGDQFCPYSLYESSQIENCFKTYQCLPVQCEDHRVCYINFQSQLEIDITANDYQLNSIKRVPPISGILLPSLRVCLTGIKTEIKSVIDNFNKFLHSKVEDRRVPISQGKELFESHTQQYCIKAISNGGNISTLRGVPHYVGLVVVQLLDVISGSFNGPASDNVPSEWEPQRDDVERKPVRKGSKEWSDIEKRWKATMSCPIKKVERIQNKWFWKAYSLCQVKLKTQNSGQDNEKWLFHGTKQTSPEQIYRSDKGFDFRFSNSGMWGNGIYFAVNASYSAKTYSFTQFMTGDKQIFLARVLTGDSKELPPDKSLKMPPLKDSCSDKITRYDSVKGNTGGSDIYVVYEHDKAYPAYLITF